MRSGRSALGLVAGVLLGLGVVALAGSGFSASSTPAAPIQTGLDQTIVTSTQTATTTSASGTPGELLWTAAAVPVAGAASVSQVSSIPHQPIALTGIAFLPVVGAGVFGFVLYRISRARDEEE
jgi:hypothetical protein